MTKKNTNKNTKRDISNKSLILILLVLLIICLLSLILYLNIRKNIVPLTLGGAIILGSENTPPLIENNGCGFPIQAELNNNKNSTIIPS